MPYEYPMETISQYVLISYIIFGVGLALAAGLFVLAFFVIGNVKNVRTVGLDEVYPLDSLDSLYVKLIKFDRAENAVVIRKQSSVTSMNVSLISNVAGKKKVEIVTLNFSTGEVAYLPLPSGATAYGVEINYANKRKVKASITKGMPLMVLSSIVAGLFTAASGAVYAYACNFYLTYSVPEYATVYVFAIVLSILLIIPIGVVSAIVLHAITYKGGK